ncbi:MAG TPA: SdrD B-like domain-containing protein, partial [Planctomycetota bacterium]|nr:SdrD B-like domain-containing protein [Planctomycetota bacterium]
TVPVLIDDALGLEAADLQIFYDTALLDVLPGGVRKGALTSDGLLVANVNDAAGLITVGLAMSRPRGEGGGRLLEIDFQIKATADSGPTLLDLRRVSLDEDGLIATQEDGQITVFRPGEIRGVKFEDVDGDGIRDAGDPALAGWTIFLDGNENGGLDPGEVSRLTDATGAYVFSDLTPGQYLVAEELQPGWIRTLPADPGALGYPVDITISGDVVTRDFGNFKLGEIRGVKFEDLDGDGQRDLGEPGLQDWTIFLDADADGVLEPGEVSTITDASGAYAFPDLGPGNYVVVEQVQPGWRRTLPADPAARGYSVDLTSGASIIGDFGNIRTLREIIGTEGRDRITLEEAAGHLYITVNGITDTFHVVGLERVEVFGLGGGDRITLIGLSFEAVVDGGKGDDVVDAANVAADVTLLGGPGDDHLKGGRGHDLLIGGTGHDHLFGRDGADTFVWHAGDGQDVWEGGAGSDTALLLGTAGDDRFTVRAHHDRVSVVHSLQAVPVDPDMAGIEHLRIEAHGGADRIVIGNLSHTDVQSVWIDAGAGDDRVDASALKAGVDLTVLGGAGDDTVRGGHGDDLLLGGEGADLLIGGSGPDVLIGGAGADRLVGGPGDDLLIAGRTIYDADPQALCTIFHEWTSEASYGTRVARLTQGVAGVRLTDATVLDDGVEDTLTGAAGTDWFFATVSGR